MNTTKDATACQEIIMMSPCRLPSLLLLVDEAEVSELDARLQPRISPGPARLTVLGPRSAPATVKLRVWEDSDLTPPRGDHQVSPVSRRLLITEWDCVINADMCWEGWWHLNNHKPVVMRRRLDEGLKVPSVVQDPGHWRGLVAEVSTASVVEEIFPRLVSPLPQPHAGGSL